MYIVVSGVHGIGKTTLARGIAAAIGAQYLTESVDERIPPPVLGPNGNVVLAELWMARQSLLKESRIRHTGEIYVADRSWADIYAYTNSICTPHEKEILLSALDHFPKHTPDVHLIVHAPVEVVASRIKERQRKESKEWNEHDVEYLQRIQNAFLDYHRSFNGLRPMHLVDVSGTLEENIAQATDILSPYLTRRSQKIIK